MTVIDTATGYEVRSIPLRTLASGSGHIVEFSREGSRLTTDHTGELRVWNLHDSTSRRLLFADASPDRDGQTLRVQIPLAVSRDGRFLAVHAFRQPVPGPIQTAVHAVDQIDLRTGRRIPTEVQGFRDRIEHVEYSPDGRWIGILLFSSVTFKADPSQHAVLCKSCVMDSATGEIKYPGKTVQLVRHDKSSRSLKSPRIGFTPDGAFLLASYMFAIDGPPYSSHWDVEDVAAEKVIFSTAVGVNHDVQFAPASATRPRRPAPSCRSDDRHDPAGSPAHTPFPG
jgi:hypothetical protein